MLVTWLGKRVYPEIVGKREVFSLMIFVVAVLAESTIPM